jgi:putative FmdB family regulatory protein
MPTYQYACTSCGERLEAVQKFSDDPLTECPACGGTLRKVFSAVGVVFKGSGFYKTDSRNKSSSSSSSSSSPSSSPSKSDDSSSPSTTSSGSSDSAPSTGGSGDKKSGNTDKVA